VNPPRRRALRDRLDVRIVALLDVLALFAGRIGGVLVTLLFIPRYHALLGGQTFGAVSIVLSLQAFFLVSDLGLATLISRDTAIARDHSEGLTRAVWMRRRAEALLGLIALVVAIFATGWPLLSMTFFTELPSWSFEGGCNVAMIAMLIMALVAINIVQLSLNALGDYQISAASAVVGAIIRAVVTVAVLMAYPTLTGFLVAQLVLALLHLFAVRLYLEHRCAPLDWQEKLFELEAMRELLRRCIPLTVYTLASAAAVNLDKTIVSAFISLEAAGIYFLATMYALVPVAVLSGPINSYFAPRVAHARHVGDAVAENRMAVTFQLVLMCAVIGPSLSLGFQMMDWLQLWLDDRSQFAQIVAVAPILLAGGALSATGYYPTTRLIAGGDNNYLARLSFTCGIGVLILATFFASRADLIGLAWSYFAFYAAGFAGLWLRLATFTGWRWLWMFLLKSYVVPAVVIGATYLSIYALTRNFSQEASLLLPIIAAGICSTFVLFAAFRRAEPPATLPQSEGL
jgi:O-antigen/teichoic acid export membrane protein